MHATPGPADVVLRLLAAGAATIGESGGLPMAPRIRAAWSGATVAGPAFTVRCASGDNLAIHVAAAEAPAGSVLVVDVGAEGAFGYWGEVLTTGAETRDIAGLVIDGGVRDVAALAAHGFPAFSATIALRGATKQVGGEVGGSVSVGGVEVHSGDFVVGDADGVAVVRSVAVAEVLAAADARTAKELGLFEALRAGRTTLELLGLDAGRVHRAGAARGD